VSFVRALTDGEAAGRALELFDEDRRKDGYVWNLTRVLALRPAVVDAWRGLVGAVRAPMDARRYELVTLAAARALRASYCMLAHGRILAETFYTAGQVAAIARDPARAGLEPVDVAVMEFAGKVAARAEQVTQADVDALRAHGLGDAEILDVALAAAARAFFTKTLDAMGVQPDAGYRSLDAALLEALTVGRPLAAAEDRP